MRRALSALLLVAVLASSAGAQTTVRAPQSTNSPGPSGAEAIIPPPLPLFSQRPAERDVPACKAACAKAYYFCRANADDDSCPGEWARCDARCKASFTRPTN